MKAVYELCLLGLAVSPVAAFWRLPCKSPVVVERADPIVQPGMISAHVHQIMGGNGFDFTMNYSSTQASTCSSCTVHGDNSNYWTPALYYQSTNGSFTKVNQVGGGLIYYLQRPGPNNDKLQAFPEGFRMISGDPFKRSPGTDFASQAISYACLNYDAPASAETGGFPSNMGACKDGLRSQVFFPSCWDGVNLDTADHKSHMAFPNEAYNSGSCPSTHPVHLISIFFEIIWDVGPMMAASPGGNFVWAMGDPTGYGFHGDFLMGWDKALLQNAVDTCTADSGRVEDCPVFTLTPDATAAGCKIPSKVEEDVQGPFAQLPGCNAVYAGPDEAPIVRSCAGPNVTMGIDQTFFQDMTAKGWAYQGCATDNYYTRSLTGANTADPNMTNAMCASFCSSKGFSMFGTEYSKECYCGNSIPDADKPQAGVIGNCNMMCAGDNTAQCGGSGALSLYQKCSGSVCANAGGLAGSGSSSSAGGSANSVASAVVSSSSSISTATNKSFASSSTAVVISTSAPAVYSYVQVTASSSASAASASNTVVNNQKATSSCTTSTVYTTIQSTVTAFNKQASVTTSAANGAATNPSASQLTSGWNYLSCYVDSVSSRSLPYLTSYTLNGKPVTASSCVAECDRLGYVLAGTEYAGECYCANALTGSDGRIDQSKCDMPCKGDSSQLCGGPNALSLFGKKGSVGTGSDNASTNGTTVDWSSWTTQAKRALGAKRDVAAHLEQLKRHARRHGGHLHR